MGRTMSNINDYLLWRGDLLFAEAGFNEVDNLIFSELVYVDFRDIAPSVQSKETISLKEASRLFFERHTDEEIQAKVSSTKVSAFLMREMAKTRRFSEARLGSYVDEVDPKEQSQFCAMTIKLDDGSVFVAYSGTDSTMIGWRENFNMSFLTETPGQLKAVEYLNQTISPRQKKIRIGGHSKGGNLAVYACIYCKESIQNRILAVYSNDGPGFMGAMMDKDEYRSMLSKIHTFIPESSIVGLLLEREEDYEVIKSEANGPMQHDVMTWEVLGASLIRSESITKRSELLDKTLKAWVDKMDAKQREDFVDALFTILEEGGIRTIDDLAHMKWKKFVELFKLSSAMERENQEIIKRTLKLLLEESQKTIKDSVIKKRK